MSISIAICDDSKIDSDFVHNILKKWANSKNIAISTEIFSSAEEFLFNYEDNKSYDILLLDVEMGKIDGVELAKRIRSVNKLVQIIFITGYSDYIAEGYEVAALHYLMKPVKSEKLCEVLNRATEKIRKDEKILTFNSGDEIFRVPIYTIKYADVRLNYVTIHANEDITVKMTLKELATMLDERFYRVGRSSIINLVYITRVTRSDIYLRDGSIIPLPRGAYDGINRAIIDMG